MKATEERASDKSEMIVRFDLYYTDKLVSSVYMITKQTGLILILINLNMPSCGNKFCGTFAYTK